MHEEISLPLAFCGTDLTSPFTSAGSPTIIDSHSEGLLTAENHRCTSLVQYPTPNADQLDAM